MKDDQDLLAGRIAQLLDQGRELPESVLARLRLSRQAALGRQRRTQSFFALPGGSYWGSDAPWLSRVVFSLALVLGVALASQQWVETTQIKAQQAAEVAEIDAAMLSGDLPLDAYLDRDFYAWLNTTPE